MDKVVAWSVCDNTCLEKIGAFSRKMERRFLCGSIATNS